MDEIFRHFLKVTIMINPCIFAPPFKGTDAPVNIKWIETEL